MAGAVGGVILVGMIYVIIKLVRRYVFKIQEPNKNFVMEKKVKCKSGDADHHYLHLTVFLSRPQHDVVPRPAERLLLHTVRLQVRLRPEDGHRGLRCLVLLPSLRLQDLLGLRLGRHPGLR